MLYDLARPFADKFILANLFRYQTFRTGGAIMTALLFCFIFGPSIIRWLKSKQGAGQPIRTDGPETHLKKQGTPTMGGVMILLAVILSTLLWVDLHNAYTWIVLLVTIGFGAVGFGDDYLKLTKRNTKGMPGKAKLVGQIAVAAIAAILIAYVTRDPLSTQLALPFFKDALINLGWFFPIFSIFVIVGASNAVNLTDGLDGLAIVPVMIAVACFGLIAYLVGNVIFSNYLQLHHVAGAGELLVFCGALVGASDHSTTKALYAKDPDGLEFEVSWLVPAALLELAGHRKEPPHGRHPARSPAGYHPRRPRLRHPRPVVDRPRSPRALADRLPGPRRQRLSLVPLVTSQ